MIRYALAFLGLSAGAGAAQGLVPLAPVLQSCGGTRIVLEADGTANDVGLERASDVVSARLGGVFSAVFDYAEVVGNQIVVSLPLESEDELNGLNDLFERVEFGFYDIEKQFLANESVVIDDSQLILPDLENQDLRYLVAAEPVLTGAEVEQAEAILDYAGAPAVAFRFTQTGSAVFARFTSEHIGEPFAIVLGEQVYSAPIVRDTISGGSGLITGSFTLDDTVSLAAVLQGGVLPFDLDIVFQETLNGSDPSADFCP